ncbi:peptidase M14 [Paenibacillus albidus]|uniref:Peptidase M14 n=1 Tax=Paenibacillus albidus TaxID=2041023 RepID=A0A917D4R0_9BACL|nr:M14 family metallopeptidase [Paenibacillus albidus]GGG10594.1 peptidase M14 [Paenibacillus albidus]
MQQYITRRGDTVSRIAAVHGLTPEHVIQSNPWAGRQPYLYPGQVLFLPSAPRKRYAVQEGDDAGRIAALFGIQVEALEQLNPGVTSGHCCTTGKVLVIPASGPQRVVRLRGEYGPRELQEDIDKLIEKYPFIGKDEIGKSVLGKPLHVLRIGSGLRHLHINAALHANEWLTSPCLMSFIEEYAAAYAAGCTWNGHDPREWYNRWTVWAVPMANPDGVELVQEGAATDHPYYEQLRQWNGGRRGFRHWKANIRGVDLGDQFPAHWEEERARRKVAGPAPRDYSGPAPLSEPEAAALTAWAEAYPGSAAVSLHTQGGEIYWNYRGFEPPGSRELAALLGAASGYRAVELTGSDAGYKDWFIQVFRQPGFTVELGIGKNPLPLADFEDMAVEAGYILASLLSKESEK